MSAANIPGTGQFPLGVLWLNNDFPVVPSLVPWAPQGVIG